MSLSDVADLSMSLNNLKLSAQLNRRRDEAEKKIGCAVPRICVACEAGRGGYCLAHLLQDKGIEAHVLQALHFTVERGPQII